MRAFNQPLQRPSRLLFGAILTAAVATQLRASTDRSDAAAVETTPVVTSHEYVVVGEVVARTDTGFTVLSRGSELRTIVINRYTSIKKGAETIALTDVQMGDSVSVTLRRAGNGQLQAVDVAVRTGFESRL